MTTTKQKLELTWIGKDKRPRLEPRIFLEDKSLSYQSAKVITNEEGEANTAFNDNLLIHGDNLLALKALEHQYAGKVKCVYIDPPYNTGNAFEHYEDGLEHSKWLTLMRDRIDAIYKLLAFDGFMACHIDDAEGHYLKVMLDEVFGRENYLTTLYVQVRYANKTLKQDMDFHKQIEQVHVYRKGWGAKPNLNKKTSSYEKFNYYIKELAGGKEISLGNKRVMVFQKGEYLIEKGVGSDDGLKEVWASGTILDGNSSGRFFRDFLAGRSNIDGLGVLYRVDGIGDDKFPYRYFTGPQRASASKGKYYQGVPIDKLNSDNDFSTTPIENYYDFAANFGNCRHEGGVDFRSGKKPEALVELILKHFSNPGDLVLDSFAGSGTTAAVAHKMGRQWITIELAEQAVTHVVPRIQSVIDGKDMTGVTEKYNWQGGGGFRYLRLAPSLLKKDDWGNWVINKEYNAEMLAEAMCKHMGFTYAPSQTQFWNHGYSTETDHIYVTTGSLAYDQLHVQDLKR
ncbi:site-specific DNA-methyltransferase [Aeromonas sp. QDB18]|uniref:site-specific DNA-methyltransferase n=1 Tax=Aeromonas sp. QDB18 TaxID=2990486 RepID=UPI0022E93325|nr:site-specific DNA-methyltransferase [Aeromonas sp. QDB18]